MDKPRRARTIVAIILAVLGVAGVTFGAFGFLSQGLSAVQVPETLPTTTDQPGEVKYNDSLSYYRPPTEDLAIDEETGIEYVTNEILIMFELGVGEEDAAKVIAELNGTVVGKLTAVNRYEVLLPDKRTAAELQALADELTKRPEIVLAYLNRIEIVSADYIPNDREWSGDWGNGLEEDDNWGMEAINAPDLWDYRGDMETQRVGIMDAGFGQHEDMSMGWLEPNVPDDHGVHVAGTIKASVDNGIGVAGVVPVGPALHGVSNNGVEQGGWSYVPPNGYASPTGFRELGLVYLIAERRVKAINHSMGLENESMIFGASHGNEFAIQHYQVFTPQYITLMKQLLDAGNDFLFISAAGNDNACLWDNGFIEDSNALYGYRKAWTHELPWKKCGGVKAEFGSYFNFIGSDLGDDADQDLRDAAAEVREHIIVVGATGIKDGKLQTADFSDGGSRVDIQAPGVHIQSTVLNNVVDRVLGLTFGKEYGFKDGTSMAAPHVTGAAAALWSMKPTLTSQEVKKYLFDTLQDTASCDKCFLDVGAAADKLHEDMLAEQAANPDDPWAPIIPEDGSGGATLSLVFDTSGSMADSGKIESARQAGLALMTSVESLTGRYEDEFAVGVSGFNYSGYELVPPTTSYADVRSAIEGLGAGGGTDIYDAVRVGMNQLTSRTGAKTMVLLSDGMDTSGNSHDKILTLAREAATEGIKICTVGFGTSSDIDEVLLQQIAQETGCTYSFSDASNIVSLVGSFVEAELRTTSQILGKDEGTVAQGETSTAVALAVPNETGDLTSVLYWPGSQLDTVLVDPDGVKVDATYPGASLDTDQIPAQIVVEDPKAGQWSMSVYGRATSVEEEPYFAIAAFRDIERDYQTAEIAAFAEPYAPVQRPDLAMALEAVSTGLGAFLIILALAIFPTRRRDSVEAA
jgi:subtilisin family serine protease